MTLNFFQCMFKFIDVMLSTSSTVLTASLTTNASNVYSMSECGCSKASTIKDSI